MVIKYYEAIPVGLLKVDDSLDAQRMFQRSWAGKLAKIWDPGLLLAAAVSRRPGGDYLIDGQHSTRVALECEGPGFLRDCMVYEGLTIGGEARLFLAANRDRKQVRHYDIFRVSLTAGEAVSVRMDKEVRSCGLELGSGSSTNRVGAVAALRRIAEQREGLVARVLRVAEASWGRSPGAWDNTVIQALAIVLNGNWGLVDDDRLVGVLQARPVLVWKADGVAAAGASGGGSTSRSQPLAGMIVSRYNSRLSERRRLA